MVSNNKVLFVAGHSGGHILPCVTQSKIEKERGCQIYFITTHNLLDKRIFNNFDFIDHKEYLTIYSIQKYPLKLFKCFVALSFSFFKSLILLKKIKPSKIVNMGGLISIPVCLAGKLLNIPLEIWELNVEPGKAIKFLSNFVNEINICHIETKKYFFNKKCNLVSYPVRFNEDCKNLSKELIVAKLNFFLNKKTILIIGGSQGSQFINSLFKEFILKNLYLHDKIQVIHQTGVINTGWNEFYKSINVTALTFGFYDKMDELYVVSDLVICRSGAGTLAEVNFFKKKCITIPLESKTTNHQLLNAKSFANMNPELFVMIKQNEDPQLFDHHIKTLLM